MNCCNCLDPRGAGGDRRCKGDEAFFSTGGEESQEAEAHVHPLGVLPPREQLVLRRVLRVLRVQVRRDQRLLRRSRGRWQRLRRLLRLPRHGINELQTTSNLPT